MRTVVGAGVFFAGSLLGTSSGAATIDFDFQTAPCSTATDTCSMLNGSLDAVADGYARTMARTRTSTTKPLVPAGHGRDREHQRQNRWRIDTNEQITATISTGLALDSFRLLFIYNGPEYTDPERSRKSPSTRDSREKRSAFSRWASRTTPVAGSSTVCPSLRRFRTAAIPMTLAPAASTSAEPLAPL